MAHHKKVAGIVKKVAHVYGGQGSLTVFVVDEFGSLSGPPHNKVTLSQEPWAGDKAAWAEGEAALHHKLVDLSRVVKQMEPKVVPSTGATAPKRGPQRVKAVSPAVVVVVEEEELELELEPEPEPKLQLAKKRAPPTRGTASVSNSKRAAPSFREGDWRAEQLQQHADREADREAVHKAELKAEEQHQVQLALLRKRPAVEEVATERPQAHLALYFARERVFELEAEAKKAKKKKEKNEREARQREFALSFLK